MITFLCVIIVGWIVIANFWEILFFVEKVTEGNTPQEPSVKKGRTLSEPALHDLSEDERRREISRID